MGGTARPVRTGGAVLLFQPVTGWAKAMRLQNNPFDGKANHNSSFGGFPNRSLSVRGSGIFQRAKSDRRLAIRDLGRDADFEEVAALQERLLADRIADRIGDTLLLLEHRPVFTLGRSSGAANVLWSDAELNRRGIGRVQTTRGGDVTYHGPGQLVGYPILHLGQAGWKLLEYVGYLEEMLIRVLAGYGIASGRDTRNRGVWVGNEKIAAIGIRVSRQVTMHGFALNVNTHLEDYRGIVACGMRDAGVTSLERILGKRQEMETVKVAVTREFRAVFGYAAPDRGEVRGIEPQIDE